MKSRPPGGFFNAIYFRGLTMDVFFGILQVYMILIDYITGAI